MAGVSHYPRERDGGKSRADIDAAAMSKLLSRYGVTIEFVTNCHILDMKKSWQSFMKTVQKGDAVVVFLAGLKSATGHGLLARGFTRDECMMHMLDEDINTPSNRSLDVNYMLTELNAKQTRLNLILIDCWREFVPELCRCRPTTPPVKVPMNVNKQCREYRSHVHVLPWRRLGTTC